MTFNIQQFIDHDEATEFDERTARKIMKKNMVCSDFFKWDFEHWKYIDDKKQ